MATYTQQYYAYVASGGKKTYTQWLSAGMPATAAQEAVASWKPTTTTGVASLGGPVGAGGSLTGSLGNPPATPLTPPPPPTTENLSGVTVEVINGRLVMIVRDAAGDVTGAQDLGPVSPEGMTASQQAQLDLAKQRLQWEVSQAEKQAQPTPFELAQMKEWEAEQYATKYAGPRNWIQRWYYENAPDAFAERQQAFGRAITTGALSNVEQTQQDALKYYGIDTSVIRPNEMMMTNEELQSSVATASQTLEELGYTGSMMRVAEEQAKNPPPVGKEPDVVATPEAQEAWNTILSATNELGKREAIKGAETTMAGYGSITAAGPAAPSAPPAPSWLPWVAPGQVTGQPISPERTKWASGQTMSRLGPSQVQGIGGFVDWSAGRVAGAPASYEDWLAGSQALLPRREPRRVYSWSPSYARA